MWWDNAQTVGSMVRWYFADDAPFLPFPHRFATEIYDKVHWWQPGAGVDSTQEYTYDKGAPPPWNPSARRFCGRPEWYTYGCPSDAPPAPRLPNGAPGCCFGPGSYSIDFSRDFDVLRA
jgi:hypothetical protein